MKALIIAAGFGTRLEKSLSTYTGPEREQLLAWAGGKPKGLVTIKGKALLSHQLEQLTCAGIALDGIFIHTNKLYYPQYRSWADSVGIPHNNIFNNRVVDEEHRLGAVGDLRFALQRMPKDNIIMMACDTLLYSESGLFSIGEMVQRFQGDGIPRLVVYAGEKNRLSNYGIVEVNKEGMIIGFEEKPAFPRSHFVNASLHLYSRKMVDAILAAPLPARAESGQLIAYLCSSFRLKAEVAVRRVDVGTVEDIIRENVPIIENAPEEVLYGN